MGGVTRGALALLLSAGCSAVNTYPAVRDADDAASLAEALVASEPGDYVRLTERISGSFLVPAGVTVVGSDTGHLEVPVGGVGLSVAGGDAERPTIIRDLEVRSSGRAGILGRGGAVRLDGVRVEASGQGVAVMFEDVEQVELTAVTLVGDQPQGIFRDRTQTSGLVLLRVAQGRLDDVTADAFGRAGVALIDSTVTWRGGSASGSGQAGLVVHTSSVTLADIDASSTRGLDALAGAIFSGDSEVSADGLSASLSANFGMLQFGGQSKLTRLEARANDGIGVVLQDARAVEVELLAERNYAAGLLAVDVDRLRIHDSLFREHARSEAVLPAGNIAFGDGAQLVRVFEDFVMTGCELDKSYRVALLLVPEGERLDGGMFEDVRITGFDDQLGAIRQGGEAAADWDRGILRSARLLQNDEAQSGNLPFFDRLDPTPFIALGASIAEDGLDAVAAP